MSGIVEVNTEMELADMPEQPEIKNINVQIMPNGDALLPSVDSYGNAIKYFKDDGSEYESVLKNYSPYIPGPPTEKEALYKQACANDDVTISSWHDQWLSQITENNLKNDFNGNSVMQVAGSESLKPVIIAGSGPSLRKNAHLLKSNWTKRIYPDPIGEKYEMYGGKGDIKVVSCLHNFAFFEDLEVMSPDDFYITLDAGEITIKEISEGGKHSEDWYWDKTKERTLVAHTFTHPVLIEKWQGRVLWYSTPSNPLIKDELEGILDFKHVPPFNVGGNVLGAALYMARAILGCGMVISIGADFSFSRDRHFHGWNSQYDAKFSGIQPVTDIYGDRVYTWPSYYNFKAWFDYIACGGASNTHHEWVNATEGGILGAYPQGNIQQIRQMNLRDILHSINLQTDLKKSMEANDGVPRLLF